ncbi:hypothetical protein [Simkania sp.]|uniref:hypothetical protein n=1 Tax=Simkania sp. TaxID=34094 RepID=UPI003B52973D
MANTSQPISGTVLFTNNPVDNFGDVSCALKCARSLVEAGTLQSRQVEIRPSVRLDKFRGFDHYHFKVSPLFKERKWHDSGPREFEEISGLAFQVVAPSNGCGDAFLHLRRKGVKTLSLFEYGFNPDRLPALEPFYLALGLGLGEDKKGIFIEHDWEKQHALTTRAQRMERFTEISPELQRRILGELPLPAFAESCGLYVGYSNDDTMRLGFVDAILNTNLTDETLVLILPRFDANKHENAIREICELNQVKTLIISDPEKERFVSIAEEGRAVRLCVGSFDHHDLLLLWQSSEEEALVTGDQSVSEAISANKRFCYEERDHKQRFASSMTAIFSNCDPERHPARGWHFPAVLPTLRTHNWNTYTSCSTAMQKLFDPKFRAHFTAFNREVCLHHNCVPHIDKAIREMLESEAEKKIVYLFDSDAFDPTQLEDGIVYIISLDQMLGMKIKTDTGESLLPELNGKTFENGNLKDLFYVVQTTL